MEGFIAEVMVAFVFFAVLLPLVGLLIGWFCYYVLPYLFGGVAVLVISLFVGGELVVNVWAGLFALVWAISVHFVRSELRAHGHDV